MKRLKPSEVCDMIEDESGEYVRFDDLPGWVSVKERLPPSSQIVLFVNDGQVMMGAKFCDSAESTGWENYLVRERDGDYQWVYAVTHWMPLPEPPENK